MARLSEKRLEEIRQMIQSRSQGNCSDCPMRDAAKELLAEVWRRKIEDDETPYWDQQ